MKGFGEVGICAQSDILFLLLRVAQRKDEWFRIVKRKRLDKGLYIETL